MTDSSVLSKFADLVVVVFTTKEKRLNSKKTEQQPEQTHHLLVSILVFVRHSKSFCASRVYVKLGESRNQQ